jgi:hypothetical protein
MRDTPSLASESGQRSRRAGQKGRHGQDQRRTVRHAGRRGGKARDLESTVFRRRDGCRARVRDGGSGGAPPRAGDVRGVGGVLAESAAEQNPMAPLINSKRKYVVSTTLDAVGWENTTLVKGDLETEVSKLKEQSSGDLLVSSDTGADASSCATSTRSGRIEISPAGSVRLAGRLVAGTAPRGQAGRPRRAVPRRPQSARHGRA